MADETPEGRSITVLAKQKFNVRERSTCPATRRRFVPFTAQTRMSGVDIEGENAAAGTVRQLRKGAGEAIRKHVQSLGGSFPADGAGRGRSTWRARAARRWWCPTAARCSASIELKDIVKGGIKERFAELRRMGIKTVMITGDNRLTAAAIAAEAGVDDFLAEATPEAKLKMIRDYQADGRLVAMTGDGTNDAPALAQADVAVAMNTGTQAAKEAGNMVDLDSNPTKLLEIVETGKQLLMTRGSRSPRFRSPTTWRSTSRSSRRCSSPPTRQLGGAERHGAGEPVVGDPVGGDLQRAGHRVPDPAGAQGREGTAPSAQRRCLRRNVLVYGARWPDRAVHRHQGSSTCCWSAVHLV